MDQLSRLAGLADTLSNVATLSWVSSIALVAAVIGAVWLKRKKLRKRTALRRAVAGGGTALIGSFIYFGCLITNAGTDLADAYRQACDDADNALCRVGGETAVIDFVRTGCLFGTVVWVIILALWIILWWSIAKESRLATVKKTEGNPAEHGG
jgi:hypothetical protein